jgi:hypothetical protein
MLRLGYIAIAGALLLSPDVHPGSADPLPSATKVQFPEGQSLPVLPNFDGLPQGNQAQQANQAQAAQAGTQGGPAKEAESADQAEPADQAGQPNQAGADQAINRELGPPDPKAPPIREQSRLLIIRYVSGEFAKVVTPLPGGKKGFHFKAGAPVDQDQLRKALTAGGAALNVGDSVQITKVEFHGSELMLDINGGPRGHTSWRDHVQLGMGGGLPVSTSTSTTPGDNGTPVVVQKAGATIYLDFGRSLPDMSPDQVKSYLARVLDFSKQRSAAVQWIDTLPPKVREAIAAKRADVGMDHDQVTAALGRPQRKVRERDVDGNDIEDWIYGTPPAKTTFVRFAGDKVVRVSEYP